MAKKASSSSRGCSLCNQFHYESIKNAGLLQYTFENIISDASFEDGKSQGCDFVQLEHEAVVNAHVSEVSELGNFVKWFWFLYFNKQENAPETIYATQFGSKSLYVARGQKKSEQKHLIWELFELKMKAKVSNIHTEEELRHMSEWPMCDEKGISKGFVSVCFPTPIDSVKTFYVPRVHVKPLSMAIAQSTEDRQMQSQVQFGKRVEAEGGSSSLASVIPGIYLSIYYNNTQSGMVYVKMRTYTNMLVSVY